MTAKNAVSTRLIILIIASLFGSFTKGQLTANFTSNPSSGCSPLIVGFTDQSAGVPVQWRWDLGNGAVSNLQNPSTTYFSPGTYTVKLVIYNAGGNADSITKIQYITVYANPVVNFSANPLSDCIPFPVQLTDQSSAGSGTISSRQWDFGDGTLSSENNPSYTYTTSGAFNVSLRITNNFGCITTLTKPQYITAGTVHADFDHSIPPACVLPSTITFQNLSTGSGTVNYQWDFGDGNSSTQINPVHTYNTAGNFIVRLIVTNDLGCTDTITDNINISTVNVGFTNPDMICQNKAITFTNTSSPTPANVFWTFGDGSTSTLFNPVKTYTLPGLYQVKFIANFGSCVDSLVKNITVLAKPTAFFSVNPSDACITPTTITFTNLSINGTSYQWDFGDGTTSTQVNPTHTYTSFGVFTPRLITINNIGCRDTIYCTNCIKIQPLQASINALPARGCVPLTHTFSALTNSNDPIVSYSWDFGDGTTSTQANPTHTFALGSYDIRLIVVTSSGCTDTVIVPSGVRVNTKPVANFSATPRDVCARMPISFTDLSTGNITNVFWTFGDGGSSTTRNPIYNYQDTGYFNVRLIVANDGCPDTIQFDNYIHISPPIANFSSNFGCRNPTTRLFTDRSIGADEWHWDFGDGTFSTLQNPVHQYAGVGNYVVTLRVRNRTTGCEYTRSGNVQVIIEKANFTVSDTVVCRNADVNFSAWGNTVSNVASYNWSFGDGSTGTGSTISHAYSVSGKYTVQLIVADALGCRDTLTKPLHIEVSGPVAGFSPSSSVTCFPNPTVFNDNTVTDVIHPITSWVWNFGDGNITTFTSPPFFHTYTQPATYHVSLKVTDSEGCSDSIQLRNIVAMSKPITAFTISDSLSCLNIPITFNNTSSGTSLAYTWDFGDGITSSAQNNIHSYTAPGSYNAKLNITDQYGCTDSLIKTINIVQPSAIFTISDSVSTCPPLVVNFSNNSENFTFINWDFGDGTSTQSNNPSHFYSYPGIYHAKLTVTSPGGCIDTLTKIITISGPQGIVNYGPSNGCNPLQLTLTASATQDLSFVWDFNDGNILATDDSAVVYTYRVPGNYVPKIILIDSNGCQVPVVGLDTVRVKDIAANFGFDSPVLCNSGPVNFSDSSWSNDGFATYRWSFGDGDTAYVRNPIHVYGSPGLYNTSLIVTTLSGCIDTLQHAIPIRVVASPQAAITRTTNGCVPLTVIFNGNLTTADTSVVTWNWNFNNGNTSTLQNPPAQLYNSAGQYTTQLIATNSSGCEGIVSEIIDAYAIPMVNAGTDIWICKGAGATLQATGTNSYSWSPATGLNCTNCDNPVASPDSSSYYIVTGTSLQGCTNQDTIQVNVQQPFTIQSSLGDTLCRGNSVRLFASGADAYQWSPATGLSSSISSTPLASPPATTNYRVIGSDNRGCFTDTAFVEINVYPLPTVEAGENKTINAGQTIVLTPEISADVSEITWLPPATIVGSNNSASVTVKPKETTTYFIEVRNEGGCKAKDELTVFVICNGANVFMPNTFSPNGDGINDIFYPRGSGLFSIKTLRIFNRWGEVIFEKGGFAPNDAFTGWNGTYKGTPLPSDVFVYTAEILCDNNSTLILKGNIALIR